MWTLENQTPFAVERGWVRDKDGSEVWIVAVKGTFAIAPDGRLKLAEEQLPVTLATTYRAEPGQSSLLAETDLVHRKQNTDVVVLGHVYAPQGQPASIVDAGFKLANIHKMVRAVGDRIWEKSSTGLSLTKPKPFVKMPVIYERSFGGADLRSTLAHERGWEERNPIGAGFAMKMDDLAGKPAPNIENPSSMIFQWNSKPRPIGLGPIPVNWAPRVKYGGTYDQKWEETRQPLLPNDFNDRFHQSAPEDQQTEGFLLGGETVELTNLTPGGFLKFRLPKVTFRFETSFGLHDIQSHSCNMHTVVVEPDVPQVAVVWHTYLPCHHNVLKLLKTTIAVKRRINVSRQELANGLWVM